MPTHGARRHLRFHVERQDDLISRRGTQVIVFPVLQCPCLTPDRQFTPRCPGCRGTGRYYPPGQAFSTTLLLYLEDSARTFTDPGTWTLGTIRASILSDVKLCERDKVRWVDIKDTFTDEVLVRGLDDTVRFTSGVTLLLVADLERVYRAGIDYTLAGGGTVAWLATGVAPAMGAQYSVKYDALPEFLVMRDSPRLRVEHRNRQSQEVVLQRLDMLEPEF